MHICTTNHQCTPHKVFNSELCHRDTARPLYFNTEPHRKDLGSAAGQRRVQWLGEGEEGGTEGKRNIYVARFCNISVKGSS